MIGLLILVLAGVLVVLGYLARIIHVELVDWLKERKADQLKEWGGDTSPHTTAWDAIAVSPADLIEVEGSAELATTRIAEVGRHRPERIEAARLLVHASDGTSEFPLVPTRRPGVLMSRRGYEAAEERRSFRDRSSKNIDRHGDDVAEVSSSPKAVLPDRKDREVRSPAVQRPAYAGVSMSDWT